MTNLVKAALALLVVGAAVGAAIAFSGGGDEPGTTTTAAGATTTTGATSFGGCTPVGSWRLDDVAFFVEAEALAGEGDFEYLSGHYYVAFGADGSFTENREAWRFRVTTVDGVIEVETNGDMTGTWIDSGASVEILASESNTTGSMWVLEDGELVPLPIASDAMIGIVGLVGRGDVECVSGALVLHMESETGPLPVRFDPVG